MANEVTLAFRLDYTSSNKRIQIEIPSANVTVSGSRFTHTVQSVGTSEEALELGDISTGGLCFLRNHDTSNYVEVRSGTGATDFIRLNAGEFAFFRMSGDASAPYGIANTAAVNLEILFIAA